MPVMTNLRFHVWTMLIKQFWIICKKVFQYYNEVTAILAKRCVMERHSYLWLRHNGLSAHSSSEMSIQHHSFQLRIINASDRKLRRKCCDLNFVVQNDNFFFTFSKVVFQRVFFVHHTSRLSFGAIGRVLCMSVDVCPPYPYSLKPIVCHILEKL